MIRDSWFNFRDLALIKNTDYDVHTGEFGLKSKNVNVRIYPSIDILSYLGNFNQTVVLYKIKLDRVVLRFLSCIGHTFTFTLHLFLPSTLVITANIFSPGKINQSIVLFCFELLCL